MDECGCLEPLFRLLWVGVTVYSIFMDGCDCLEHFYGWMWVGVTGCDWVWMGG